MHYKTLLQNLSKRTDHKNENPREDIHVQPPVY